MLEFAEFLFCFSLRVKHIFFDFMNTVYDVTLVLYGNSRVELGVFANPATGAPVRGLRVHGQCEEVHCSLLRFYSSNEPEYILELSLPVSFVHVKENAEFATSSNGHLTSKFGVLVSGSGKVNLGDASFDSMNVTALGSGSVTGIGRVDTSVVSSNGSATISGFYIQKELIDGCDPTAKISVFGRPGVQKRCRYTVLSIQ